MTMRTTIRIVSFARPFVLAGVEGVQPPGTYDVEIDEERLEQVSFPVYRRIRTAIRLPWRTIGVSGMQTVLVNPQDLESALARDAAAE